MFPIVSSFLFRHPMFLKTIGLSLYDANFYVEPFVRAGSAGATLAGRAALERAALVLGQTAPDARVLTGLDGPLEARVDDRAAAADSLGLVDLQQRRAGVPDGEEQLGVLVETRCAVAPIHGTLLGRTTAYRPG